MKRLFLIFIALIVLCLVFASCDNNANAPDPSTGNDELVTGSQSQDSTDVPTEDSELITDAPTENSIDAPTEGGELITDASTENPTDTSTEDGEFTTEPHVHDFVAIGECPATCTEDGFYEYLCSCGEHKLDIIPKTPHMFTNYVSNNDATCAEDGTKTATCEVCYSAYNTIADIGSRISHEYGDWYSSDNITMYKECTLCDDILSQPITETGHDLSLIFGGPGASHPEDKFKCSDCNVTFDICDVLKYTVTSSEHEGKFALVIEAKISSVRLSATGLMDAKPELIINCDGYTATCDGSVSYDNIAELIIGDGISGIYELNPYNYIQKLTVGADVDFLGKECISDCFLLRDIFLLGDLPKIESTSLYTRHVSIDDSVKVFEPCVYYLDGAEGFENYKYKIQGCTLKKVGDVISRPTDMTLEEYSSQSVITGMSIATDLFKRLEESGSFLHLIPYANINKYKEIKDLSLSLTEGLSTEREKAQAIYNWITENIRYDEKAMYYHVEQIFDEKIAVCNGYASLMHDMLAAVGISSLYTHGIMYVDGLTVDQIIDNPSSYLTNIMYHGNGHGWLTVYADGEAFLCDPTWSDFDISPDELAKTRITLGVLGISTIPESIDPLCYEDIVYYDNGELFALLDGNLSAVDSTSMIFNFSFNVNYRFHTPNDGYALGDKHFEIKNAYHDILTEYGGMGYEWRIYVSSSFVEYKYIDVLKFVVFENIYYGKNFSIEYMDDFIIDKNGHIYLILDDDSLCFVGTASQDERIVIPAQVYGRTVKQIGVAAFSGSYASEIILPDTINYIYSHAFLGCGNLVSIKLPSSLTHMEIGVFAGCVSLENVYLPASVQVIGLPDNHRTYMPGYIFDGCDESKLTVYYDGTAEDFEKIHFNNPWGTEENGFTDIEQYEHVLKFVKFKD